MQWNCTAMQAWLYRPIRSAKLLPSGHGRPLKGCSQLKKRSEDFCGPEVMQS